MVGFFIRLIKFIIYLPAIIVGYIIDMRDNRGVHLYGIYGFFGLPGKGKTMAMCYRLKELRRMYGNDILITTNFCYDDEDFAFTTWKQLLKNYDKPLVVAWDEIQNEFNSRDFKNFPIPLMTQLTQVRKGNGIQILYTAQRWHFVDKNFRSLSFGCYDCNTILGRYTIAKMYDVDDYDQKCNEIKVSNKIKIRSKDWISFYQTKKLRNSYDSFKMLETAKSKEYMSREETINSTGDMFS